GTPCDTSTIFLRNDLRRTEFSLRHPAPRATQNLEIKMIRLLLGGTALTAVLITGALAQSSSSAMESSAMSSSSAADNSATSSSAMMDSSAMSSQMSTASSMDSSMMSSAPQATSTTTTTTTGGRTHVNILPGYTQADTDHLASKIIGSPVYDGTGDKAN